jgi:eukaryotic-like serine/threonine-protein kinase
VTELDQSRAEIGHGRPWFLPDGKRFLFLARSSKPENNAIFLGSLESKKAKLLMQSSVAPIFAPPRFLLFMRDNTLLAQEVDLSSFDLVGNPTPIAEEIANNINTRVGFSASRNGLLVYRHSVFQDTSLMSFNRPDSQMVKMSLEARYRVPKLSPDGQRLAGERIAANGGAGDIWILDLARNTESRFTSNNGSFNPIWSPDGKQIVFRSTVVGSIGDLYLKDAGGGKPEELLLKTSGNKAPTDWSGDGRYIVYDEINAKTGRDIFVLPTSGDRKPVPFLQSDFNETNGHLSADGKWMAYQSNETGRAEIYVQSFPPSGNKWKISTDGGSNPRWRGDAKELFYEQQGIGLFVVEIKTHNAPNQFEAGLPKQLTRASVISYDVTSNGQRIVMDGRESGSDNASKLTVVINWMKDLAGKK